MAHSSALLRYHEEDRVPRTVEDLSQHGRLSRAFIRLCLSLGCPSVEGRLSLETLLDWLFENYTAVRATAGLAPLAELGELTPLTATKLKMGNGMVTLLEYSVSRATDRTSRKHLHVMMQCMERALDH